ncbi:FKBP-type peptidyl-prolyl cis-trans isomerase [Candidatus Saccharibacteria bacterium]|nr:FKBP-type peptidyl-prolyl cis-trans isomerase [Candidatus Saccharibacteria bacterium]
MRESELKTSWKQRIFILIIAVLMLGSTIAMYIMIIVNSENTSSKTGDGVDQALVRELEEKYTAKKAEVDAAAKPYAEKYLSVLAGYKSEVRAYNETAANTGGLVTRDLRVGTGREITKNSDMEYFAYYIGFCADESVFDSSFEDFTTANRLKTPLDPSYGLIEGWTQGVIGMKLDGVREITVPGELAYGDTQEICGGTNKPLKFIVLAFEKTEPLETLTTELDEISLRLSYARYGIDYDDPGMEEATEGEVVE